MPTNSLPPTLPAALSRVFVDSKGYTMYVAFEDVWYRVRWGIAWNISVNPTVYDDTDLTTIARAMVRCGLVTWSKR